MATPNVLIPSFCLFEQESQVRTVGNSYDTHIKYYIINTVDDNTFLTKNIDNRIWWMWSYESKAYEH